jgi:hypothetical protein
MAAGFQNLRPFRKGLGRHRTRFSLFAACERWDFSDLPAPGRHKIPEIGVELRKSG